MEIHPEVNHLSLKKIAPFVMGKTSNTDVGARSVELTKPYYMGVFEITKAQWAKILGEGAGTEAPLNNVSYCQIRGTRWGGTWPKYDYLDDSSFMAILRKKCGGLRFDLPTEAQWEFAARAGAEGDVNVANAAMGDVAVYAGNSPYRLFYGSVKVSSDPWIYNYYYYYPEMRVPTNVGTKLPNAWGLYDCLGSVAEWCLDWSGDTAATATLDPIGPETGTKRVLKGYSYCTGAPSGYYTVDGVGNYKESITTVGHEECDPDVMREMAVTTSFIDPKYNVSVTTLTRVFTQFPDSGFRLCLNLPSNDQEVFSVATSGVFCLSVKHDSTRVSSGDEICRYSGIWNGDDSANVVIKDDGVMVADNLVGEGDWIWSAKKNGAHTLTHTTYTNGIAGKVETAVFVVSGKNVPVGELTLEWETATYTYDGTGKTPGVVAKDGETVLSKGTDYTVRYEGNTNAGTAKAILTGIEPYVGEVTNQFEIAKRSVELVSGTNSKVFDGVPLVCHSVSTNGDGFAVGEGVTFSFTGEQTNVGSSKNTFTYTLRDGTLSANYTITKADGDLTVTSADIVNPFDPDDPYSPVTSEVLSKANCVTNYDGEGHAISVVGLLNPLVADSLTAIEYSLDLAHEPFAPENPTFTNVVSTSVWYRITSSNFKPFTTNAVLTILPRSIANVAVTGISDQTYTGSSIEPMPTVTDLRMLTGMLEATDILSSADYDLSYLNNTNVGTAKIVLLGKNNYDGAQTNTFQIVPAIIPPGPSDAIILTGYTNAYDGVAHGVSVTVTGLKTTPTVEYKVSPSAEWQNDSPTFTDVCDTQVWWRVTAPNYASAEGTVGVMITQAVNVWTAAPVIEGWAYGETAKMPVGAAKFGAVVFAYDPMPVSAAGEYTLTATVAETMNYSGLSQAVPFTIAKATLPSDRDPDPRDPSVDPDDPSRRNDPAVRFSKYDYVGRYDGVAHTVDAATLADDYAAALGETPVVSYSSASNGVYGAAPFSLTDVGVTSFWYRVSSANYEDVVKPCKVVVTNRCVTLASGSQSWPFDGNAHSNVTVTVGGDGFVAGEGVVTNGFATITDAGSAPNAFAYSFVAPAKESNYAVTCVTGTLTVVAPIAPQKAMLSGRIAWKLLKATGTYFAQLQLSCTNGLDKGIDNLRFMFADRVADGVVTAALWDSQRRAAKNETLVYNDDIYRYVTLDATRFAEENMPVVFGVSDLGATSIPTNERMIELYVRTRVNPSTDTDKYVGYVGWSSGGETMYLPVAAGAQTAQALSSALMTPAPMTASALNTSLAVGAIVTDDSNPYCKLVEFSVTSNEIIGRVEVGARTDDGQESVGALGLNATVTLLGAKTLTDDFAFVCAVAANESGSFIIKKPKECQFFKLRLTVGDVVR